jgi:hypothetical protein
MVLRSIKKLRSSSLLSRSAKSKSNVDTASIETPSIGTGNEASGDKACDRDDAIVPDASVGVAEEGRSDAVLETEERVDETKSREAVVDISALEERESAASTSTPKEIAPAEPQVEHKAAAPIQSPRFHPNWTKEVPQPQPSIEISHSETEIEVVAGSVEPKKEKMFRLPSFIAIRSVNKSRKEAESVEVKSTVAKEAEFVEVKSTGDVSVEVIEPNTKEKSSSVLDKVQRIGSLRITVLDTGVECLSVASIEPVAEEEEVPLVKSTSTKSAKSLAKSSSVNSGLSDAGDSKGADAASAKEEEPASPSSVFAEIGNMFQRMGSYTRSMSRQVSSFAVCDTNVAADEPVAVEEQDKTEAEKTADEARVQSKTSISVFPEVGVSDEKSDLDELEVALNRSTTLEKVQSLTKSIASTLELAIEESSCGPAIEAKSADEAETNVFEVALDDTAAAASEQKDDTSLEGVQSLVDNTYVSVKSMVQSIFSALEVALEGTAVGQHMAFKQEGDVSVDCEKSAVADAFDHAKSQEECKSKSVADDGSVEIAIGAVSVAKSAAKAASVAEVNGDVDVQEVLSVATSVEESPVEDGNENGSRKSAGLDQDKPAGETQVLAGAGNETMGKALLDNVLHHLAKAEVAAKSDGNTAKQVKIHLLRLKLLHLTNRTDKWANQLEGAGEPDEVFISGPFRRLMNPMLGSIGYGADMIDRCLLDGNTACLMGADDFFDHQCVDHTQTTDGSKCDSSIAKDQDSC